MGVLNITPDSFSDGGLFEDKDQALEKVKKMLLEGADIIDIGGESSRPGATPIKVSDELERIIPVIQKVKNFDKNTFISVDSRKSEVMEKAIGLGVNLINDISSFEYDKKSLNVLQKTNNYISLMHGGINNVNLQEGIEYQNIIFDVINFLKNKIELLIKNGIEKSRIIIDPGIGFRKNAYQDIVILKNLILLHNLGCPILIGASRKSFIGSISNEKNPLKRVYGSVTVAVEAVRQGVEILRVHDVYETKQALMLFKAMNEE